MKTRLNILAAVLVLSCASPERNKQPAFDAARETEAIHEVINRETDNFFAGNYEEWKKTWKQYNADKTEKLYFMSHETRLMQKEPDGWKIVNVSAFWDSRHAIPADSLKKPG